MKLCCIVQIRIVLNVVSSLLMQFRSAKLITFCHRLLGVHVDSLRSPRTAIAGYFEHDTFELEVKGLWKILLPVIHLYCW
jgi:hypothetical protein